MNDSSDQSAPPRSTALRGLFRVFILLTLLIYAAALYQLWHATLRDTHNMLTHINSMLVQSVRATLTAHELILRGLGTELLAQGALEDPSAGRSLIDRMQSIDPGMVGFGLARPNGQLVMVSGIDLRGPLPNLMALPEARESFRESLSSGQLVIGRPYYLPLLGHWVVPIRVPIRNALGKVQAVMTAGYGIEGGTTAWANMALPEGVEIALLRDDGYLMYWTPLPPGERGQMLSRAYGQPVAETTRRMVADLPTRPSFRSATLPRHPAHPGVHYLATDRINEHGLWAGAFVHRDAVLRAWAERLLLPSALLGLLLIIGSLAYRRALQQQIDSDGALTFLANHDSLTQLANRNLLHEEIRHRTRLHVARPLALMLFDLNRFKEINDTLGHHVGDVLLCQIGPRIRAFLADREAFIARLGGDEFTVLLPGLEERSETLEVAHGLIRALARPYDVEGLQLHLGAALGISFYPRDGADSHALLRAADVAMYAAKQRGSGVELYDPDLDVHTPERLALMTELGGAIEQEQMVLHYQPKLDLASGQVRGLEALVRWQHPERGLLYPDRFMHLAEVSEVIHRLTESVLRQALAQQREWKQLFPFTLSVAVNLSARNLIDDRLLDTLRNLLETYGTQPDELELEITETSLMVDPEGAADLLKQIAALGVRIVIDDFGTGYSSLGYLHRLPISELKIDRLFVGNMVRNEQDAVIVRSTIGLAHNLNLKVVAEGVEDDATMALLREMGCDRIQGYFLSRPKAWADIEAWLIQTDQQLRKQT